MLIQWSVVMPHEAGGDCTWKVEENEATHYVSADLVVCIGLILKTILVFEILIACCLALTQFLECAFEMLQEMCLLQSTKILQDMSQKKMCALFMACLIKGTQLFFPCSYSSHFAVLYCTAIVLPCLVALSGVFD